MCEPGQFVTIAEAAQMLETTEMRVLMMLKQKELVGKQEQEAWFVEKVSLQLCGKPVAADIVRPGGCGGGCGGGERRGGCGGH